jgi:hypothetical protein
MKAEVATAEAETAEKVEAGAEAEAETAEGTAHPADEL